MDIADEKSYKEYSGGKSEIEDRRAKNNKIWMKTKLENFLH